MNSEIIPEYTPRFLTKLQTIELLEYWRMTGVGHKLWSEHRTTRMHNACKEFCNIYTEVSYMQAYKDLDGMLQIR